MVASPRLWPACSWSINASPARRIQALQKVEVLDVARYPSLLEQRGLRGGEETSTYVGVQVRVQWRRVRVGTSMSTGGERLVRVPLLFDPGSGWEYGIGIDLVGKVIEEVTGQDLESYLRRHILDPLAMYHTSFLLRNDMAQRLVGAHMRGPDGKPISISIEPLEEPEFHTGGAGLFSTAPDYVTFTRMLLAGGTLAGIEVLKPETV